MSTPITGSTEGFDNITKLKNLFSAVSRSLRMEGMKWRKKKLDFYNIFSNQSDDIIHVKTPETDTKQSQVKTKQNKIQKYNLCVMN